MSGDDFLSRWSRRKTEARRTGEEAAAPKAADEAVTSVPAATPGSPPAAPEPLPPVESLTPESDFSPFMRPGVDPSTRRLAVKKLFEDPRYNVMDGLDIYIDDYSKPDPLPEGWLEKMTQVARLGIFEPAPEAAERKPPAETPSPDSVPGGSLPASQAPLPSVTSGGEIDASPVTQSPPAEG